MKQDLRGHGRKAGGDFERNHGEGKGPRPRSASRTCAALAPPWIVTKPRRRRLRASQSPFSPPYPISCRLLAIVVTLLGQTPE